MNLIQKIRKIIELSKKILAPNQYDRCYEEMELRGCAIGESCGGKTGGDRYTEYLSYDCVSCPYLVLGFKGERE